MLERHSHFGTLERHSHFGTLERHSHFGTLERHSHSVTQEHHCRFEMLAHHYRFEMLAHHCRFEMLAHHCRFEMLAHHFHSVMLEPERHYLSAAPLSLRGAAPLSLRNAAPLSLRDTGAASAPLSLRDTASAPLSLRDSTSAPLSRRDAAPASKPLARRDAPASNALYVRDGIQVSSDHVLRYLRDRNLVTWVPSGAGFAIDVSDALWELGLDGAARRKRSFAPMTSRKRALRLVDDAEGSVVCYEQQEVVSAARLQRAAADACDALARPPSGAATSFRLWETVVGGAASHLRFGVRALGDEGLAGGVPSCQATVIRMLEVCAVDGNMASGDVMIDDRFLISVDPVNLAF
ncbi:hypothetical protein SLS54_007932 [Diplodia seriata]